MLQCRLLREVRIRLVVVLRLRCVCRRLILDGSLAIMLWRVLLRILRLHWWRHFMLVLPLIHLSLWYLAIWPVGHASIALLIRHLCQLL